MMIVWRLREVTQKYSELLCAVFCTTVVDNDMHTFEHFLNLPVR